MYTNKYHNKSLSQFSFLVTGGAGFIGSNIVDYLLKYDSKKVRVLDNLSNGHFKNIEPYLSHPNFEFIEGDIRELTTCKKAMSGIDYVTHQAALGSVPRSINDPATSNAVNISGFLNMMIALKESNTVKKMIYAASSSTYGDSQTLPKVEGVIGKPLSPYAVTKYVNELYADVFGKTYHTKVIGLRYFNIFGPKQSPKGAYAAVIPLFLEAVKNSKAANINGDGEQTRDFTYVENAVQANIKGFFAPPEADNEVYNIACGERISINYLWGLLNEFSNKNIKANYRESRIGDVRDSLANISKAKQLLGYEPKFTVKEGLKVTWNHFKNEANE